MLAQIRFRWRAWALWVHLVVALLLCPALVAGPMIAYVVDPELLVLAVLFGTQSGRMELGVFWLRVRTGAGLTRRRRRPTAPCSARAPHLSVRRTPSRRPAAGPGRQARGSVRPGRTTPSRSPARPR